MSDRPIAIVCALEFERRHIVKAHRARAEIICAGPGPAHIPECLERLHAKGTRHVILAGVAGALRTAPLCPPIAQIVDRQGQSWQPSITPNSETEPGVTLLAVDEPVTEPEDKAALAVAHDADLVDCESHAFAHAAASLDLTWAVVRAVSDGPHQRLPPSVLDWTDSRGRTRPARVLADLIRHPSLIPETSRLAKQSSRAMHAACRRLKRTIAAMEHLPA